MDPVEKPACAVCGATTDLVGRPEHGWVCAVSGPCIDRSAKRTWLSMPEAWKIPSDIPEQPRTGTVLFVPPYHREVLDEETAKAIKGLVPYTMPADSIFNDLDSSRCMHCHGNGTQCPVCRLPALEDGTCLSCEGLGYILERPDYGALGYPETEVRNTPHRFETLAAQVLSWWR